MKTSQQLIEAMLNEGYQVEYNVKGNRYNIKDVKIVRQLIDDAIELYLSVNDDPITQNVCIFCNEVVESPKFISTSKIANTQCLCDECAEEAKVDWNYPSNEFDNFLCHHFLREC